MPYDQTSLKRWRVTLFIILIGSLLISCAIYINGFIGDLFRLMTSVNFSYWATYPGWRINQTWLNRTFPLGTILRMLLLNAALYAFAVTSDSLFHTRLLNMVATENVVPYLEGQFFAFAVADLLQKFGDQIQEYLR